MHREYQKIMPLSKLQKVVVRNALQFAKKLKACEGMLYIQIPPSMNEFNSHMSKSIETRNREVLQEIYPPELHELIDQYPSRVFDGETFRRFVSSAVRLNRSESESSTERIVNEDMALEAIRRLSEQVKDVKSVGRIPMEWLLKNSFYYNNIITLRGKC